MRKRDTNNTTATVEKDAVVETIRQALKATPAAPTEAYGDVRSSSTVCTDNSDQAVASLENAAQWISEYRKEVLADERRSISSVSKPASKPKEECHICESEIDPGDVAICGGCDKPTCPECMGDAGICQACEAEEQ
jgi:hypothetical protein